MKQINRDKFAADLCRSSFEEFVREFWEVIIPEEVVWNWHMSLICDELEAVARRVFARKPKKYDLIINVPPGTSKSTLCSIMFPAWTWTVDQRLRHICGSHTYDLTIDLSRKTRTLLESEKWKRMYPHIRLDEAQNTKEYFLLEGMGYRKSTTVGGKSPMGFHGHFLIIDDPIDPVKAMSEAGIKNANDWMAETLPSRKVSKAMTPIVLIMQRLHQNDPTGKWLQKMKDRSRLRHISLPADCEEWDVVPKSLKRYYKNGLLDPLRMPKDVLADQLVDLGQFGYAGQFGQSPIPRSGGVIKSGRIARDTPPPLSQFQSIVRFWDKAATDNGGKRTAGVKMGEDRDGRIWVLHVEKGQWGPFEREAVIKSNAQLDTRKVRIGMEQEPGSSGKDSIVYSVQNLKGFRAMGVPVSGDKVTRAEPFASQVNGYNVWMAPGEWNEEYVDELKYFPAGTYSDQVDASSGAYQMILDGPKRAGAL